MVRRGQGGVVVGESIKPLWGITVLVTLPPGALRDAILDRYPACPEPQGRCESMSSVVTRPVASPTQVEVTTLPGLASASDGSWLPDAVEGARVVVLDQAVFGVWPYRFSAVHADDSLDEISAAVEATARGATWISARAWPRLTDTCLSGFRNRLTRTERDTLRLVAKGFTDSQIAAARRVSARPFQDHERGSWGGQVEARHDVIKAGVSGVV